MSGRPPSLSGRRPGRCGAAGTARPPPRLNAPPSSARPTRPGPGRLAAAADAAWHGADTARVRALLEAAEQLPPPEPAVRLRLQHIRGLIELRSGVPADGLAILLPAAAEAVKTDPHLAVAMLAEAGECAFQAGDEGAALEIAALLADLPDSGDPRDALIAGLYRSVGPVPRGEAPVPSALDLGDLEELDDPDLLARAGGMLHGLRPARPRPPHAGQGRGPGPGAGGGGDAGLGAALAGPRRDRLRPLRLGGRLRRRGAPARARGRPAQPGLPAPGVPGRDRRRPRAGRRGPPPRPTRSSPRRPGAACAGRWPWPGAPCVQLALATGRPDEALVQLEAMWTLGAVVHRGLARASVPDLVEAAVRAGRPELGAERLPGYLSWAQAAGSAEAAVVALSGSVALLGDALHNSADALTAVPLGVAFLLSRSAPTRRYTYGYGRAEDLAGIVIVAVIVLSSAAAAFAAVSRLLHPHPVTHLAAVAIRRPRLRRQRTGRPVPDQHRAPDRLGGAGRRRPARPDRRVYLAGGAGRGGWGGDRLALGRPGGGPAHHGGHPGGRLAGGPREVRRTG